MEIKQKIINVQGIKLFIEDNGEEIGRAYLYIMRNDLRQEPFGFMEDVFIDERYRSKGLGKRLVKELIETAKAKGCYKVVATSRYSRDNVHQLYEKLGFKNFGKEFKMYLKNSDE